MEKQLNYFWYFYQAPEMCKRLEMIQNVITRIRLHQTLL